MIGRCVSAPVAKYATYDIAAVGGVGGFGPCSPICAAASAACSCCSSQPGGCTSNVPATAVYSMRRPPTMTEPLLSCDSGLSSSGASLSGFALSAGLSSAAVSPASAGGFACASVLDVQANASGIVNSQASFLIRPTVARQRPCFKTSASRNR